MAKEIERRFDHHAAAIVVTLEDDFGRQEIHTLHVVNTEKCPACGHIRQLGTQADLDAHIESLRAEMEQRSDRLIEVFEAHGAVLDSVKARRAERLAVGFAAQGAK